MFIAGSIAANLMFTLMDFLKTIELINNLPILVQSVIFAFVLLVLTLPIIAVGIFAIRFNKVRKKRLALEKQQ